MLSKSGESPTPQQRHEVQPGEWQSLHGEGLLLTKGLETCIGVSIYNPRLHTAFLGHFDREAFSGNRFESMIRAAKITAIQECSKIWLGGGEISSLNVPLHFETDAENVEIANAETKRLRERTLQAVSLFIRRGAHLQTTWLGCPAQLDYELDVATGEETVTVSRIDF